MRRGLGRFDYRKVQHRAVHDEVQPVLLGDAGCLPGGQRNDVRRGGPGVDGHRDGLAFDADAAVCADRFGECLVGLLEHGLCGQREAVGVAHVELGTV